MQCQAKAKSTGNQCRRWAIGGKRVCQVHGGKSPGGIASATWKDGRYSKYIPGNLAQDYKAALADPDPLSLKPDVILLRALAAKHVAQTGDGDTHPAWIEAHKVLKTLAKNIRYGGSPEGLLDALDQLETIVLPHYRAARAEEQVVKGIDQIGKVADKERRLLIDRQKVMTIEQVLALCTNLTLAIAGVVKKHLADDAELRRLILVDTDAAFTRAIGGGGDVEVIEGG